jgi:hypothetical protein
VPDTFDLVEPGVLIHTALVASLVALVVGRPRRWLGPPSRRAIGWLALAAVVAFVGVPTLLMHGRPGLAATALVLALLALRIARTLRDRRPIAAAVFDVGEAVEAVDGFVGKVVEVGPFDYAVTVEDVMCEKRVYSTDDVWKIGGRT